MIFKVIFADGKVAESFSCAKMKSRLLMVLPNISFNIFRMNEKLVPMLSHKEKFNRVLHFDQMVYFWSTF